MPQPPTFARPRPRLWRTGPVLAALAMLAGPWRGHAAPPPVPGHTPELLVRALPARAGARLVVSSPAFPPGGEIPLANTQYGANRFPGVSWAPGPPGTQSYAVVIQGQDAAGGQTSVHLMLLDIPPSRISLPAGLAEPPAGAFYGPNIHGVHAAYAGPHTHTAARRTYHLQVLALDTMMPAGDPGIDALVRAMAGHVLASGDLVGVAARPAALAPVRIETGLLAGVAGHDPAITVFKGVPYAAPPVGSLRWRPPQPAVPWTGQRNADGFGAICPQPAQDDRGATMSEDCLTLNVWTGARTPAERRPVYVWIYGGGFIQGSGSSPQFDGEGLAAKGVIVVTFNYRLGVLGFLATPELSGESGHDASGNYGLLDDVAALQWVHRNIAAFGGDPARVTIGGQSAGAGSVGLLSISPLARGLFRAAIVESHARYPRDPELRYLATSYRLKDAAERQGQAYAAAHGASGLAQLRAMPWRQLVVGSDTIDAAIQTGSDGKPPLFRPVLDGWVIPRGYAATYTAGTQNDVCIVAGNNKDESGAVPATAFETLRAARSAPRAGLPQTDVTRAGYIASAHRRFGPLAAAFLRLYPARDDNEAALQNNAAARDDARTSTFLWAALWSRHTTAPVYTYAWTHAPPGPDHDLRGAYHGAEISYAFGNLDATQRPWTQGDRTIADIVSSYWANIISTGNPNAAGLPAWPRYDPAVRQVMELGDRFGPIAIARPDRIAFWRRFYASQAAW